MTIPAIPAPAVRQQLSRFTYGVTPALLDDVALLGGVTQWFDKQLRLSQVGDPFMPEVTSWFPDLALSAQDMWLRHQSGARPGWDVMADLASRTMLRRTYSMRQVHEVMVEFWSNHLHVPAPQEKAWPHRCAYDQVIRAHALGRFDDMLSAAVRHPAMSCYLDNALSTATKLNENLGREVLELHTVGPDSGYGETEVRDSARILTGYRVDMWASWEASYAPADHFRGSVQVLDFAETNALADGRPMATRYLRYLAHHPSTARRIALKLCHRFVSDVPSAQVVSHVATAYTDSGTDIKATLRALVSHPEFIESVDAKVRTPTEDVIASARVLGIRALRPTQLESFARQYSLQARRIGQRPFEWAGPDGFPDVGGAWTGVSRIMNSLLLHQQYGGRRYPNIDVEYRADSSWLPPLPATFAQIVDHVAALLLARAATPELRQAAAQRVGYALDQHIATAEQLTTWRMARLLSTVLDNPAHMTR